jgi:hypothetical protein
VIARHSCLAPDFLLDRETTISKQTCIEGHD